MSDKTDFTTKWMWDVCIVSDTNSSRELVRLLNRSWVIVKATATTNSVTYILKKLKPSATENLTNAIGGLTQQIIIDDNQAPPVYNANSRSTR